MSIATSIPTLKIGLLTPAELRQLNSITRHVHFLTGEQFCLLDPGLIGKLKSSLTKVDALHLTDELGYLAARFRAN